MALFLISGATPKRLTDSVVTTPNVAQVVIETWCPSVTTPPTEAASEEFSKAILARAETITPLLEQILRVRPPPHWGINE